MSAGSRSPPPRTYCCPTAPRRSGPRRDLPFQAEDFALPRPAPRGRRGDVTRTIRGPAVLSGLEALRDLHRAQWEGRSQFLSSFDRFVAGCAGGIEFDEVVVHQLATDDLVVATVLVFEVAGRAKQDHQSARLTGPQWKDVGLSLFASIIDDSVCSRHHRSGLPPR